MLPELFGLVGLVGFVFGAQTGGTLSNFFSNSVSSPCSFSASGLSSSLYSFSNSSNFLKLLLDSFANFLICHLFLSPFENASFGISLACFAKNQKKRSFSLTVKILFKRRENHMEKDFPSQSLDQPHF